MGSQQAWPISPEAEVEEDLWRRNHPESISASIHADVERMIARQEREERWHEREAAKARREKRRERVRQALAWLAGLITGGGLVLACS